MKVKVRLFATLRIGRDKEVWVEGEAPLTVQEVVDSLQIKNEEIAILLRNGWDVEYDAVLTQEDVLSIFPPVGGG